jgi:FkbM family methyltransferase
VEFNGLHGYGDNGAVFVLDHFMLYVDDKDESVAQCLIRDGYWESWITSWMTHHIDPSWMCLDIGANFGYYTGVLNELADSVVAFEPNPEIYELLEKSTRLNHWEDYVQIHNVALGEERGTAVLTMNDHLMGSASLLHGAEYFSMYGNDLSEHTVRVEALDDFGLKPDFVKMDIEGFEPQAFAGGKETLDHAQAILVEVTRQHPPEFIDYIFENWDVSNIDTEGNEVPLYRALVSTSDWLMLVLRRK